MLLIKTSQTQQMKKTPHMKKVKPIQNKTNKLQQKNLNRLAQNTNLN